MISNIVFSVICGSFIRPFVELKHECGFELPPLIIKKNIFGRYLNSKPHKKHKREAHNHDYLKERCRN